jgi:hypothetical protein
MKKTLCNIALGINFLLLLYGCSKTNDISPAPAPSPAAPVVTDYNPFISEKTWWGNLTNPGEQLQLYSVHFNADLSLVWSQASGDYFGNWKLDGNHLVLNFPSIAVTVKADIAKDSTLTNITCSNTSTINSGKILSVSGQPVAGTTWKGNYLDANRLPHAITIVFIDAVNVNIILDGASVVYQYNVTESGVVFRTNVNPGSSHVYFGLNRQDGQWVGTDMNPENVWNVSKQ